MNIYTDRKNLRVLAPAVIMVFLLCLAAESQARGGGRGGGGSRGGGGGISRGGPAGGGSIRNTGSGGGYRSYGGGRGGFGNGGSREGSFENRRGETIDYSGSRTRTDDGFKREGSWSSTSGASGGGSGSVKVKDGQVQSTDRSRHAENADGETINRDIESERHGSHMDREGTIESSTGIDAESKGTFQKTDDGFIAQGGVVGDDGAAGGTIVRKGDQTYARGAATDGDDVTWGRAHCNGSHCYGGRVTADVDHYYDSPYYYYPYYYGWYSCPYGGVTTWNSRYGTPVYGCANVVVIHTTIALGSSNGSSSASAGVNDVAATNTTRGDAGATEPREAQVSSAPVLMYELNDDVVAYATTYVPVDVYSVKDGVHYYWVPGPATESDEAKQWTATAAGMKQPTANSTVITYTIDEQTVYLTNERPAPGFFSEPAGELFVWIPGVKAPTDLDRALIDQVIQAQAAGGKAALDREARKLQKDRDAPPAAPQPEAGVAPS